ncbi:MAG: substrate-binding domain-containing protein [Bacteroidales bacterium]|nr:substrate-binding domain-containing protein [Bacteroidales bacterium]
MMGKKVSIKQIAERAGVSAGTVDRIIHNRGKVSEKNMEAVEKVLKEVGYRSNIHNSAVGYFRKLNIAVTMPQNVEGDYWWLIDSGIRHAVDEYYDVSIELQRFFYNQFDIRSYRDAYRAIVASRPDAVIIGPSFTEETRELCRELDAQHTPYVMVDSVVTGTRPLTYLCADAHAAGRIQAEILHRITPPEKAIALFEADPVGKREPVNTGKRKKGWDEFFAQQGEGRVRFIGNYSAATKKETQIAGFLEQHSDIGGIAVQNSRAYLLADALAKLGIKDINIVGFDLTQRNAECLRKRAITALICQNPELQGYQALIAILEYMLYKRPGIRKVSFSPIDIVLAENLPYYSATFGSGNNIFPIA